MMSPSLTSGTHDHMPEILRRPPKYVQGFADRHGKTRWYYRRRGYPLTPLPGLPWSPDFMAAYERAAQGEPMQIGRQRSKPGTVDALIASYYQSADYTGLSDVTKRTYRNIMERFRAEHAEKRVAMIQRHHVQKMVADKAATPAAANRLLSVLHLLMRHAIDERIRRDDPTFGIRKIRSKSTGFATWEEEHIAAFLDHHKTGSRAAIALMLLICTGQRRSDVVRMGHQHVRGGFLTIVQSKTGQEVSIPLHRDLKGLIDALPKDCPTFLVGERGGSLTPESFTNWFRDCVKEVTDEDGTRVLPDGLSPHGLRKATCRRLAEAGCTAHEIMAISGHKTLAEVTRYTAAASRKQLAERAMSSLDRTAKAS